MNLARSSECVGDIHNIIVDACAKTAGAERETVSLGFIEIKICCDRLLAVNDLGEVEQRHRRIIRMYCKVDVDLFSNRNDCLFCRFKILLVRRFLSCRLFNYFFCSFLNCRFFRSSLFDNFFSNFLDFRLFRLGCR